MSNVSHFLLRLMQLRNQMKLYHWQTELHSRHQGSEEFLNKYEKILDKLIESYQGKYKTIYLGNKNNIYLKNIPDSDIIKFLTYMREYLMLVTPKIWNKNKNTDLFNLRDEIITEINKTIYLFKQK